MINLKTLFSTLILLLFHFFVYANHYVGGFAEYEVKTNNDGTFTIKGTYFEYRNALSSGAQFDIDKEIGVYRKNGNSWDYESSTFSMHVKNIRNIREFSENVFCNQNSPVQTESGEYSFEIKIFSKSEQVMLAIQRCCREENITNITDEQGMVFYILISRDGQITNHKSSPINQNLINLSIINQETKINFFESVSSPFIRKFEWNAPKKSGGNETLSHDCFSVIPKASLCLPPFDDIIYHEGFDENKPFHSLSTQSINQNTGEINFKPVLTGNFLIGLKESVSKPNKILSECFHNFNVLVMLPDINYKFTGKRFYDKNGNALKDADEPNFNFPVILSNDECGSNFEQNGNYTLFMLSGSTVKITSASNDWKINLPMSELVLMTPSVSFIDTIDIPFTPTNFSSSKVSSYAILENPRCNEESELVLQVSNPGTTSENIIVTLILDSLFTLLESSSNPFITNDTMVWSNISIDPALSLPFRCKVKMPDETFTDQELKISAFITDAITGKVIDSFDISYKLQCAFDPNDKMVAPARTCFNLTKPDEFLYYTIRFENLGNDFARNVYIWDTLSQKLDIESMEVLQSSHPFIQKIENRVLQISFSNIKLPAKWQDSLKNKGQITFRIKPAKNVIEGDIIFNTAAIFFDFNFPVITNTTMNTIRKFIAEDEPVSDPLSNIKILPNPVNESITLIPEIWVLPLELHLKIYNSSGQYICNTTGMFGKPIELPALHPGTYFLQVVKNGKYYKTLPFVKM